jgi:hypothetical protein
MMSIMFHLEKSENKVLYHSKSPHVEELQEMFCDTNIPPFFLSSPRWKKMKLCKTDYIPCV